MQDRVRNCIKQKIPLLVADLGASSVNFSTTGQALTSHQKEKSADGLKTVARSRESSVLMRLVNMQNHSRIKILI